MQHFFSHPAPRLPFRFAALRRLLPLLALLLPALLPLAGRAQTVAAGGGYSFSIHPDGTLWGSGFNGNGQLGDGTGTSRALPVRIGGAATWRAVASGTFFTQAIRADGSRWAWGRNDRGELGPRGRARIGLGNSRSAVAARHCVPR